MFIQKIAIDNFDPYEQNKYKSIVCKMHERTFARPFLRFFLNLNGKM